MKPVKRDHLPATFKSWTDTDLRKTALAFQVIAHETIHAQKELLDEMSTLRAQLVYNSKALAAYRRYVGQSAQGLRNGKGAHDYWLLQHNEYSQHVATCTHKHYALLDSVWAAQQRYKFFVDTYGGA